MMFLLRLAFWLGLLILLIPVDEATLSTLEKPDTGAVNALQAASAAEAALQDMGGFCGRNPDVCDMGGRFAHLFALKARAGALMAYNFLDRQLGGTGYTPETESAATLDNSAGTQGESAEEETLPGPGL